MKPHAPRTGDFSETLGRFRKFARIHVPTVAPVTHHILVRPFFSEEQSPLRGERLAWGGSTGIFVVGADGSGLSLVIADATYPYWSPDGSRISYQPCDAYSDCGLQIADADGTHVVEFGYGGSGPWNPLVQPKPEVARVPAASEGLTLSSPLLLVVPLLALVVGAVLTRRRMVQRS